MPKSKTEEKSKKINTSEHKPVKNSQLLIDFQLDITDLLKQENSFQNAVLTNSAYKKVKEIVGETLVKVAGLLNNNSFRYEAYKTYVTRKMLEKNEIAMPQKNLNEEILSLVFSDKSLEQDSREFLGKSHQELTDMSLIKESLSGYRKPVLGKLPLKPQNLHIDGDVILPKEFDKEKDDLSPLPSPIPLFNENDAFVSSPNQSPKKLDEVNAEIKNIEGLTTPSSLTAFIDLDPIAPSTPTASIEATPPTTPKKRSKEESVRKLSFSSAASGEDLDPKKLSFSAESKDMDKTPAPTKINKVIFEELNKVREKVAKATLEEESLEKAKKKVTTTYYRGKPIQPISGGEQNEKKPQSFVPKEKIDRTR